MKRNQNAVKVSSVSLVNFLHRSFLRSLRFSLTKKRLSCCRSWLGRMDWLCDEDECDYDMRVILKIRNMRMTWPGMIDHDDNDGNDDG